MKSVRVLLLVSVAIIAASAHAQKQPRPVLRFAEVVEVQPHYVRVPCDTCGPMPDIRFTGTTFKYRCDGELYENWTASSLQVGLRVQVAGCGNLVVSKDRKAVVEGRKTVESE